MRQGIKAKLMRVACAIYPCIRNCLRMFCVASRNSDQESRPNSTKSTYILNMPLDCNLYVTLACQDTALDSGITSHVETAQKGIPVALWTRWAENSAPPIPLKALLILTCCLYNKAGKKPLSASRGYICAYACCVPFVCVCVGKKLVDIETNALVCASSRATSTAYPKYALAATKASSDMVRVVCYIEKAGGSRVFL